MINQDIELDEEVTASVDGETDTQDNEVTDNETNTNNNKSNFKALYKSNKEKEGIIAEKDERLQEALGELEKWRSLNPELLGDSEEELELLKKDGNTEISEIKEQIFTLKTPEAEEHIDDIRDTIKKYGMDYTTAWKFVKIDIPEESKTKKDFAIGKTIITKNTNLTKISPEDALNLSKEDQRKWRQVNGWE